MKRWMLWATLLVMGVGFANVAAQDAPPPVDAALADLNQRLGTDLTLDSQQMLWTWAEHVFPDASLDCPQPDQMVAQVVTRGYIITFAYGGTIYDYRAASDGQTLFLCRSYPATEAISTVEPEAPAEEATEPPPVVTLPPAEELADEHQIDVETAAQVSELTSLQNAGMAPLAWSPTGNSLVVAGEPSDQMPDGGAIVLYNPRALEAEPEVIALAAPVTALAYAGTDPVTMLIAGDLNGAVAMFPVEPLGLDVVRMSDPDAAQSVNSVAINNDRSVIASASGSTLAPEDAADDAVRLWDANTGTLMRTIETESPVGAVAFSSAGNLLAYGMANGTIFVTDLDAPESEPILLEGHEDLVRDLEFHPTDLQLASGSMDGTARLWDLTEAAEMEPVVLEAGSEDAVLTLAYNPSGTVLATAGGNPNAASADNAIRLWDTETGQLIATLEGHDTSVGGVDFSPDGAYLASISDGETLRIWGIARSAGG